MEPALHSRDDVFEIQDDMLLAERPSSSGTPHSHMNPLGPSPLAHTITSHPLLRPETPPAARRPSEEEASYEYTDERAREVITGRLVQGHIVDDDYPSPALSSMSASVSTLPERHNTDCYDAAAQDPMTSSFVSTVSSYQPDHTPGVSYDAAGSSDDEESGRQSADEEKTITLVGHVKDKTVFIVDDMIDKCGSWIAAAETVVKKGGATKVYCIATHGLFDDESLEQMEQCECIDHIVITNSFPITQKTKDSKKLVLLDLSTLISEGIRRHHYGERFAYSYVIYPCYFVY